MRADCTSNLTEQNTKGDAPYTRTPLDTNERTAHAA